MLKKIRLDPNVVELKDSDEVLVQLNKYSSENKLNFVIRDNKVYLRGKEIILIYDNTPNSFPKIPMNFIELMKDELDFSKHLAYINDLLSFIYSRDVSTQKFRTNYLDQFNPLKLYKSESNEKQSIFKKDFTKLDREEVVFDFKNIISLSDILTNYHEDISYFLDPNNFIGLDKKGTLGTKDLRILIPYDLPEIPYRIKLEMLSICSLYLSGHVDEVDLMSYMRKVMEDYVLFSVEFKMFGGISITRQGVNRNLPYRALMTADRNPKSG